MNAKMSHKRKREKKHPVQTNDHFAHSSLQSLHPLFHPLSLSLSLSLTHTFYPPLSLSIYLSSFAKQFSQISLNSSSNFRSFLFFMQIQKIAFNLISEIFTTQTRTYFLMIFKDKKLFPVQQILIS